jgi:hypothetical protein
MSAAGSRAAARVVGLGLIALAWLAAALAAAELAARTWPRKPDRRTYVEADSVLHHRLKPSHTATRRGVSFRTNALGLKDREYPPAKPADVFRILILGDSFVEGFGLPVEDTMPKQLESELSRRRCRARVEVVNGGVAGYSPILEYLFLKHAGLALAPDLVVLAFDMTDVHDDFIRSKVAAFAPDGLPGAVPPDRRGESGVLAPPLAKPRWLRFLDPVERSANHLQIWQSFRTSRRGQALLGSVERTPERLAALGLIGDVQYDPVAITRDVEGAREGTAWAITERYLGGMAALARRHGVPLALVVYPHSHQVSATESPGGRRKMGVGPGFSASDRPFRRLDALGRRHDLPVIDLVSLFRERSAGEGPLFFADDMHHNARGARVFADGVLGGLLGRGLLPCA